MALSQNTTAGQRGCENTNAADGLSFASTSVCILVFILTPAISQPQRRNTDRVGRVINVQLSAMFPGCGCEMPGGVDKRSEKR